MPEPINFYAKTIISTTNLIFGCSFNGADASTVFTDLSTYGHSIVAVGGAEVDTDQSIAGGASVLFGGGATNQLRIDDNPIFHLGTAGWAIELYYMASSTTGGNTKALLSQWADGGFDGSFIIFHTLAGASQNLRFSYSTTGTVGSEITVQWGSPNAVSITTGTWRHLAAERIGADLNFYANSTTAGNLSLLLTHTTDIGGASFFNSSQRVNVSNYQDGASANQALRGWIDELSFDKEVFNEEQVKFYSRGTGFPLNFYSS